MAIKRTGGKTQTRTLEPIKTPQVELAVADYFEPRRNLCIPNVSWGFLRYEADIVVLTKAGYMYEVEVKVSIADLRADAKKKHKHDDPHFRELYFAIPEDIQEKAMPLIPENAGVLVVKRGMRHFSSTFRRYMPLGVDRIRAPKRNSAAKKLTPQAKYELARLGSLRVWGLKLKIDQLKGEE